MRHLDCELWTLAAEVLDYRIAFDRKLSRGVKPLLLATLALAWHLVVPWAAGSFDVRCYFCRSMRSAFEIPIPKLAAGSKIRNWA